MSNKLWTDERIEDAVRAKAQAIVDQGNTVNYPGFWMGRARVWVNLEMRDEYEQALAAAAAEHAAALARVAELEAGIKAMYKIDQVQDSRMDTYALGFNHGYDWASQQLDAKDAEHAAALKNAYGEGFSIALDKIRGLESQLAERSEWQPVAYPGDEIDQKFVFEKMEEIYSTYKRNGHRDTLAVCRRKQREDDND